MAQHSLDLSAAAFPSYSFHSRSDQVFTPTAIIQPVTQSYSRKKLAISVDFLHREDDRPGKLQFPVIPPVGETQMTKANITVNLNSLTLNANTYLVQYALGIAI